MASPSPPPVEGAGTPPQSRHHLGPQDSRPQATGSEGQTPSQDKNRRTIEEMRALRTAPSIDGSELPRFGDISACEVSDADEEKLWELEATRLVDGLATAHAPLTAPPGMASLFGHDISHPNFAKLERVADQLLCALAVCELDDKTVLLRFDSPESYLDMATMVECHQKLAQRLSTVDETIQSVHQPRGGYFPNAPLGPGREFTRGYIHVDYPLPSSAFRPVRVHSAAKPVTAVADAEALEYYLLVDYITATLARLLAVGFESHRSFWHHMVLTALAKLSVKLKVLSHDLPEFAAKAMREMEPRFQPLVRTWRGVRLEAAQGHKLGLDSGSSQDPYIAGYISDMSAVSAWLFHLMRYVLTDLETRNTRGRATDEFDISVTVYGTGPRLHPTMVYQDRRGYMSGSPSGVAVGMCQHAFDVLVETAATIPGRRSPPEAVQVGGVRDRGLDRPNLRVATGLMAGDLTLDLRSMAELISVMIPLSCMNPDVAEGIYKACRAVSASGTIQLLHKKSRGFAAFASLGSAPPPLDDYRRRRDWETRYSPSLSQSFLVRSWDRATTGITASSQVAGRIGWRRRRQGSHSIRKTPVYTSITERHMTLQPWAIEETAISVGCLGYTLGVLSGCAVLVIGGLLVGFLVGSRIEGVDPFNMTMFSWIIAGFIMLVAKSVRVADWPWRDFFKGRVTCRSVQELASVTGHDEQAIIMRLLSLEFETPLLTKGPYNSAFSDTDSGGFSIDAPPKVGTLAESGIVTVEVLSESGPALVCLDLRPRMGRFPHSDPADSRLLVHAQDAEIERLVCFDHADDDGEKRPLEFRMQRIRWVKIIGVYNDKNRAVM